MKLSSEFYFLRPYKSDLVRVGPKADCGYVVPRTVVNNTGGIYSVGISTNWEFEVEMARKNPDLRIRAFDRTSGWTVFAYAALRDLFRGDPSDIEGTLNSRLKSAFHYFKLSVKFRMFFSRKRVFERKWVKGSSTHKSEISFTDSIKDLSDTDEVMLKIDIEGGEYELSDPLLQFLNANSERVNCLVMEFHDTRSRRSEFEGMVKGISAFLPIVHIHGNNCAGVAPDGLPEVVEITFAKDCERTFSERLTFPLPDLDYPNDRSLPDLFFAF
jgi:hypothetical protein